MNKIDQPQERRRITRWATRLDPNYTLSFGCKELHSVFFAPNEDFGGLRGVVVMQIPETTNDLFAHAMEVATLGRAPVVFICDTARSRAKLRQLVEGAA